MKLLDLLYTTIMMPLILGNSAPIPGLGALIVYGILSLLAIAFVIWLVYGLIKYCRKNKQ